MPANRLRVSRSLHIPVADQIVYLPRCCNVQRSLTQDIYVRNNFLYMHEITVHFHGSTRRHFGM